MLSSLFLLCLLADPAPAIEPPAAPAPPAVPPVSTEIVVAAPAPPPVPALTWRAYGAAALSTGPGDALADGGQAFWFQLERAGIDGARWVMPWLRLSGVAEVGLATKDRRDTTDNTAVTGDLFARQLFGMAETPVGDLRAGITWFLFGAGDTYRPATLQLRGLPGQVAARGMQAQARHVFRGPSAELEIAAGVARSHLKEQSPDWQGRVRFAWNGRRGLHASGSALTREEPLSIGISGLYRQLTITEYDQGTTSQTTLGGGGVSLDLLVPVLAARLGQRATALTFTGSAMLGRGIADLYSTATQDLITTTRDGQRTTYGGAGAIGSDGFGFSRDRQPPLYLIDTRSLVLGLQYRPARGPVWGSVNYGRVHSGEIAQPGPTPLAATPTNPMAPAVTPRTPPGAAVRDFQAADINLFVDPVPYLRVGGGYQWLAQTFSEGTNRTIHRLFLSVVGFI